MVAALSRIWPERDAMAGLDGETTCIKASFAYLYFPWGWACSQSVRSVTAYGCPCVARLPTLR